MNLSILFIAFSLSMQATGQERFAVPLRSDNGMFFLTQDNSLVVVGLLPDPKYFGDVNKFRKASERIVKVPTSILSVFGLYPGMTIQNINVEGDGKKSSYTLGKDFFALLRLKNDSFTDESGKEVPTWNKFNVLLTESPEEHKKIAAKMEKKEQSREYWITGFAYAGKGIDLKEGQLEMVALDRVDKKHSFFKAESSKKANNNFKSVFLNGNNLILEIKPKTSYPVTGLISNKGKIYYLFNSTNAKTVTDDGNNIRVGNWINGAKTIFYDDTTLPQVDCFNLMIFSKNDISKVEFECKGRAQ